MLSTYRITAAALLWTAGLCNALAVPNTNGSPSKRADPSLTGYLGAFFLGNDPDVYFYLSDGNDATSFSPLNGGRPILVPSVGTGGVRDPAVVEGGGGEAGSKWYMIGTDLDIALTTWDASQRTGSRGIIVWESTNLVDWTNERLVEVEGPLAGMVWAPEAIWDAGKGQYFVHWASRMYDASDVDHSGASTNTMIRYAYTSDFRTFTEPQTYIDYAPADIIDLNILPNPAGSSSSSYVRFMKDNSNIFVETTTTGLFGTWTRPGGDAAFIRSGAEGPAAFWDNVESDKMHLLVDYYMGSGYKPLVSSNPGANEGWVDSATTNFPTGLRHGSVLPINATMMSALSSAQWS